MSAPLQVSSELAAAVQRMRRRTWLDDRAAAFEAGAAPTRRAGAQRPSPLQISDPHRERRRARKRLLGGSSNLPPEFRGHFTDGERAALCVISGQVKRHGLCDLSLKEIGDRAGIGRTLVQRAIAKALAMCLIERTTRKQSNRLHLTSIIKIRSTEWNAWIKRAPAPAGGYATFATTLKKIEDDTDAVPRARAREIDRKEGWPTKEAIEVAGTLATIAGATDGPLNQSWRSAPTHVQKWLDQIETEKADVSPYVSKEDFICGMARWVMGRKPDDEPPRSPRYFEPEIKRHIDKCRNWRAERLAA